MARILKNDAYSFRDKVQAHVLSNTASNLQEGACSMIKKILEKEFVWGLCLHIFKIIFFKVCNVLNRP